ncbi:MAG: replicative DNA helicase [Spirochaetes bacterium]|nr:replicative DNA helicase [Spirochaetota bacterium]
MAIDRMPPQDIEIESSCLASILLSKDAFLKVSEILSAEDFYLDNHRIIFESIIDLEKSNRPIDLITLKQRLKDKNLFDKIGGDPAIVELYRTASTSSNAEYYARRIKELSLRRSIINVSSNVIEKCFDASRDTDELVDEIEHDIFKVTERRITRDFMSSEVVMQETMHDIRTMYEAKKHVTGLATGFNDLDYILTGLHKDELIIIAGRPSMGKTSLALNIANNIALQSKETVLFFSLEMPAPQLGMRLLCIESLIDAQSVRRGKISPDELKKLYQISEKIAASPIYIDDSPAINILQIRTKARRMAQKEKLGVIVVDYLQLIAGSQRTDRHLQIAEITRSLKQIARELSVPVIALSQLSRAVESRTDQRPHLSDLRESGAIEQDADVVLFIFREERVNPDTEKKGMAEVIVAKQRNGPVGNIDLLFWEQHTKFGNLDKLHDAGQGSPSNPGGSVN